MRPITPVAIARVAYEARRLYSRALGENVQPVWDQASTQQRDDTLSGVQAVLSGTANSAERLHDALTQQPYIAYGLNGGNRGEVEGIMVNEGTGGGGSDFYYLD